ncbi:uncharacterized protein LOC126734295 [Anthonomus grandis grandis]|uniref:uncharacterized protein LOC126734295 n=1 Tax=Anthonomus grandis grandis TaxID=2921223 RepID=UPI00216512CE|nr:uncharacterized protein LOC126734295 [Anthonomus grandis grandis]
MDHEKLIKKRGSVKAKLTNFQKYVNNLLVAFPQFVIEDQVVFIELRQRIDRFGGILDEFDDIQGQIELLSDNPDEQYIERENFEKAFYEIEAKAKRFLGENTPIDVPNSMINVINNHDSKNTGGVKLPVIEISTYDGEYEKWLEFRDTYESLIHQNTNLSSIQKFHYLKSYLGPSVLEIIASLELSATNYDIAWALICDRFNNNRILVQNHVKALFNIQKLHVESSSSLRKLVDSVAKHLRALKTLNEPVEAWDTLVIFMISSKLDEITLRKWEQLKTSYTTPTLDNLTSFLKERAYLLESLEQNKSVVVTEDSSKRHRKVKSFVTENTSVKPNCSFCKQGHYIQNCPDFLKLNTNERLEEVKKKHLCLNCLRASHMVKQCYSRPCKTCRAKHNTLLHFNSSCDSNVNSVESSRDGNIEEIQHERVNLSSFNVSTDQILLSTVSVDILDKNNKPFIVRALLDAGSQSSFLTERFRNKLGLPKTPVNIKICGFNESESECKVKCIARIKSKVNGFCLDISCLVVPHITNNLPNFKLNKRDLNIPHNITLADPNFDIPGDIDMLIGADYFWDLICVGQLKLGANGPYAQKTKFGWIVSGRISSEAHQEVRCHLVQNVDLDKQLTRFWEIEEFPRVKILSSEEKACEQHFLKTFKRDSNNRFVVTIPLLESPDRLGNSYDIAEKRFLSLERKFDRDESFKAEYCKFIKEYELLGHMRKLENVKQDDLICYYMPHHGVLKESSLTTKLRVVFDASCPSSSGVSLNDLQMTGPTIQSDLFTILVRYRQHNYVIAADVEKMYRMCQINENQSSLQRILWRDNKNDKLDTYELVTVTYGTKSAAFLAIRCLYQLGIECEVEFPEESRAIKEDFYVDDLLTGSDSIERTIEIGNNISLLLSKAGFHLRKWVSNSSQVLEGIHTTDKADLIDLGVNENTKTLGLFWNGRKDSLFYKISEGTRKNITKRVVLSEIAQLFDPLGLLSATTILAKIILRDIWLEKIGWDNSLSYSLYTRWLVFRDQLNSLNNLEISRRVICTNTIQVEIHGFSDASACAYGACVYIKSTNINGDVLVRLICAKSKVAPLKTQTIPKLELTAALLLARLTNKVKLSLNVLVNRIVYWCDSTIVLGWLGMAPNSLQVFVANRVVAIQELSDLRDWKHVPTKDNPADYVSRGVNPNELLSLDVYWFGPPWLKLNEDAWPKIFISRENLPELRKIVQANTAIPIESVIDFSKYSSLGKLERIIAYCLRFKQNCLMTKEERKFGPLEAYENKYALNTLVKLSQHSCFFDEIRALASNKFVDKKSKLAKLHPFLDKSGVLRVGGRLTNSNFSYHKRHPIILSAKHEFTKLHFLKWHKLLLHPGPQLLLSSIREGFWPLAGRNLARKIYRDCVYCFRANPTPICPIMGNLPKNRVNPAPPFFTTGVDYAGPFSVKDRQGRGFKVTKAYICLFICFVTRAIHLELVSDLTTEAFLASFKRFVSRRGKPNQVYSDNGSNFLGANQELKQLGTFLLENKTSLTEYINNEGISWSFIPPHSPHFGGLWEAGVKATKHHLKRVAGNAVLTFERFYTLLVQIEAVLNSRPLSPLSADPSDYAPLTPSHFLIGRPVMMVPEADYTELPENRLSHFEQIQRLQQHFWRRWSLEYISELQQRLKWRTNYDQLNIGDLVVVKKDNLPPCKWLLGRIDHLHPGKDGISRVASIKTRKGLIKRSFAKICPLPKN